MLSPGILNSQLGPRPTFSWRATSALDALYPSLWGGLLGLWAPALGNTGGRLMDLSGRGNHGTLVGALSYSATPSGPALTGFSGTAYVTLPATLASLPASGNFTLHAIVTAPTGNSTSVVFGFNGVDDLLFYARQALTTKFRVFWRDVFASVESTDVFDDWVATAMSLVSAGDTDHRLYQNGVLSNTNNTSRSGAGPFSGVWMGCWEGSTAQTFTNGLIHVAAIYNRALTPWEIRLLARDPLAPLRRREPLGVFPAPASGGKCRVLGGGVLR